MAAANLRQYCDNRLNQLRTERYSWWLAWRELADYIIPRRYKWLITPNQGNRGSPINQRIVDSTGTLAVRTLAAGMMSGITSPARPWFKLTLEDQDLAEYQPVQVWLETVQKRMLRVFADSNFYNAMHVAYEDLAVFGTAPMLVYEDFDDVIHCYNPCAGEYFLAQNWKLEVDTFYREFVQNAAQVVGEFGIENVSDSVKSLYGDAGNGKDREIIVGHAIEPMDGRYRETYWELGSSQEKVLRVRWYDENPALAARWYCVANDVYGRSPGMDALGDIKQLQVETKRKAQGIDKMVNPPLVADVSLKNEPASVLPGGITYVNSTALQNGFKPVYEVQPRLQEMMLDIQEVQKRVKECFFYDLFLMISQLDTVRTATEIAVRKEEKLIALGPVLERFQNEFLDPVIERTFNIMMRASVPFWRGETMAGLLPPPPPELETMHLEVEYVSMLAEAQKAIFTTPIERLLQLAGNLTAVRPDAMDKIDVDAAIDSYANALGCSPKIIVPQERVNEIRAQRAAQQQGAALLDQTLAGVKGAEILSKTNLGGGQSALSAMVGA